MIQAYEVALIEIRKELDAFFGKYAKDNKVSYKDARKRLSTIDVKSFQSQLREWYKLAQEFGMAKEYQNYLKLLSSRVYISRLEHLEASIRFEIEKLSANKHNDLSKLVEINYLHSYYSNYYNLSSGIKAGVKFEAVNKLGLENAVKTKWEQGNYSSRVWNDRAKLVRTMEKLIPQSFSRGLNSNKIGDMIAKELNTSKNHGRTLARTEVNYLCNKASLDVYKIAGLKQYEYLATLDNRTSEICRGLDGFVGLVTQAEVGVNYPPMHPNCRSTTIPYFENEEDVKERIAKDKSGSNIKVPRRMSQEEWINKYAPEDQRERLLKFKNRYKK